MFERLWGQKQAPQSPATVKKAVRIRRGKKSRVAAVLTEADFKEFKRIGSVPEAHAQLGISKGVLYMWNKLGSWPKVVQFKEARALEAKTKLRSKTKTESKPVVTITRTKKASVKSEEEFPSHVYLAKLVKLNEELNKLITALVNEIRSTK